MAKASQELLDQSQWWRLKTYYIFPVLEKLRHLDHISRFLFPTVYLIYLLSTLSEVNFGIDHWKLLWSKMACYAEQCAGQSAVSQMPVCTVFVCVL